MIWAILGLAAILELPAQNLQFHNSPSGTELKAYLTRKGSNLAGSAGTFVTEGAKWNLDPRLVVAIAGAETTFGKHLCGKNNAWNWFHKRTCKPSTFESYDEGIQTVTKWLRRAYVQKGYDTIPKIRARYCAEGCDNWVKLVTLFRSEMPGGAPNAAPPPPSVSQPQTPAARTGPPRPLGLPISLYLLGGAAALAVALTRLLHRE